MEFNKHDIDHLDRKYRLNLINSVTGIKPANLVGTRSVDSRDNLAIISSVVHLGSHPAQLGLVLRPQVKVPKDTYININETGFYTINHVTEAFMKKAHYTSAKLARDESEFDRMKIEREFINDFHAPFVKDSPVKIGMKHLESLELPNQCIFIIGEIQLLQLPDESINELGQIDPAAYDGVGLAGLNSYYSLKKTASFPYVRTNEIPGFDV